tara:strand:+ start:2283 stop:4805 length:2523 start_codon:yes stop_codon:yes gene_type:complete
MIVLALLPIHGFATPANKAALGRYLGDLLPVDLDSCATCHVRAHPDGAERLADFPHNPFGNRLAELGDARSLRERLEQSAMEDSDGDGVTNVEELLSGSAPGNADSHRMPRPETLEAFANFQNRYPWRPFLPVQRPDAPELPHPGFEIRSPIDAFIAQEHESRGLKPRPEASKETWLRRVHLDLTGLSPTPGERAAFLADRSGEAQAKVVDRLLASPAYGERWGRHWMDIWRYSDWAGYKQALRDSQRHIWHWRDWIIESLNADKGYDQMLVEMLAADELSPEDDDALRATGYLARNFFRERNQWMDNVVSHTAQGFLGLTVGCAKCHDHMYDPIAQRDYYAMRAIFEPYQVRTDRVPGELDVMKVGLPRVYDASLEPKTYLFDRGDERYPIKDEVIPPAPPSALGGDFEPEPVKLPRLAWQPDRREFVRADLIANAKSEINAAKTELERIAAQRRLATLNAEIAIEDLEDSGMKETAEWETEAKRLVQLQRASKLATARSRLESGENARKKAEAEMAKAKEAKDKTAESRASKAMSTAKKAMADADKLLAAAEKAMKAEVTTQYEPRKQAKYPNRSNGRRLAFARWLTDAKNPLTARVAMNHIWLRHFGQAIVPTVNEFGAHGQPPTHPALLDWLAAEFMDQGWSMKAMHRQIVLSSTYRMSSTPDPANATIDQDNVFLWRMPSRRMEGEIVRDNLLHIANTLDRSLGGPDIPHTEAQKSKRRSIYLRHAHEKLVEFVQIFDGPKVSECYQRDSTVQPHQALALANSQLTFDQSKTIAAELPKVAGDERALVDAAFIRILTRIPSREERQLCLEFLADGATHEQLVMVLFNHNEFVTIR